MIPCRLIIDPPAAGAWNMALDEALLESAGRDGIASLRFYSWQEPTLSLGYFQPHADRQLHTASASCALVRRASGGGAILHDQELTYSIALPGTHPLAARAEKLYQAAHASLIETLAELGVVAALCAPSNDAGSRADKPFLCFQRRETGDVLLGQYKVAGSAQRRQRGAVLQHGSVLWARSKFAPELPGICDLVPAVEKSRATTADQLHHLLKLWTPRLAAQLELDLSAESLAEALLAAARKIERCKFGDPGWTCRR